MGTSIEPAAEPDVSALYVLDTTANVRFPVREHQMVVGRDGEHPIIETFKFEAHKRLKMPYPVAVKFLPNEAFIVTEDPDGKKRYDPTPTKPEGGTVSLKSGQIIANLPELTVDALVIRCNQVPGGEHLKKTHGKATLVDFLTAHTAGPVDQADGAQGEHAPTPDLLGDEMTEDELARMLGED